MSGGGRVVILVSRQEVTGSGQSQGSLFVHASVQLKGGSGQGLRAVLALDMQYNGQG